MQQKPWEMEPEVHAKRAYKHRSIVGAGADFDPAGNSIVKGRDASHLRPSWRHPPSLSTPHDTRPGCLNVGQFAGWAMYCEYSELSAVPSSICIGLFPACLPLLEQDHHSSSIARLRDDFFVYLDLGLALLPIQILLRHHDHLHWLKMKTNIEYADCNPRATNWNSGQNIGHSRILRPWRPSVVYQHNACSGAPCWWSLSFLLSVYLCSTPYLLLTKLLTKCMFDQPQWLRCFAFPYTRSCSSIQLWTLNYFMSRICDRYNLSKLTHLDGTESPCNGTKKKPSNW